MSFVTQVSSLATAVATDIKTLTNRIGTLTSLTTTDKSNLVGAVNEVRGVALGATPAAASETVAGTSRYATNAETVAGTITNAATHPAGVAAAIQAVIGAAPAALNTLDELAQALGDDANFAGTMTTALAGKQPQHALLTAIAGAATAANKVIYSTGASTVGVTDLTAFGRSVIAAVDAAAARTVIDVYSKAEIGDPATDFVAVYTAAKA